VKKFIKDIFRNVVAPMIRGAFVLLDLLNPLFYFSSLRIKEQLQGDLKFQSKKTVIFVLYQNDKIPFYVQNVLDVLQTLKVNCVLNVNDQFSQKNIEKLKKQSSQILIRRNFGFDFAAYKDTIHQLDLKHQERLVLMNDTMFYFKKNIDKLFIQLFDDAYDVIAFSQNNFGSNVHLQSFLLSFGSRVIQDKEFIKYWRNYKTFNSRYYVIEKGEIGLSRKVLSKYNKYTKVIYNAEFLMWKLKTIPLQIRRLFTIEPIAPLAKINYVKFDDKILDEEKILEIFYRTSIVHSASFVIANSGFGVQLKRDIVYRHILSLEQVRQNLERLDLDVNEIAQAIREMEQKGYYLQEPVQTRFFKSIGVR
jgi:hypothetical protein